MQIKIGDISHDFWLNVTVEIPVLNTNTKNQKICFHSCWSLVFVVYNSYVFDTLPKSVESHDSFSEQYPKLSEGPELELGLR